MNGSITFLLVSSKNGHVAMLRAPFAGSPVILSQSRSCREAMLHLSRPDPPHLIFTDVCLSDGTWEHILGMSKAAVQSVNVIIVAPARDARLDLAATRKHAFDIIAPPFEGEGFHQVVRRAVQDVQRQRGHSAEMLTLAGMHRD